MELRKMHIEPTDDYLDIAIKIYNHFEVYQMCNVKGFVHDAELMKGYEKGQLVHNELVRLDSLDNEKFHGTKKIRKNKRPANAIGGYIAHKIFRFQRVHLGDDVKWTFWRVQ